MQKTVKCLRIHLEL